MTSPPTNNSSPLFMTTLCGFMERFSNFGLFTVLVLKLKEEFHLPDDVAYTIFGLFLSISYGSLMIGGFCADRWFGLRKAIAIGGFFLIVGNLCLAVKDLYIFYLGLSIVVMGIALFKVNCASLVGLLYQHNVIKREKGFTIYYCGMNLGAVISPIVFGFMAKAWGWSVCFYINAILLTITLIFFLSNNVIKQHVKTYPTKSKVYVIVLLLCILSPVVFIYPNQGSKIVILLFIMNILFFLKLIFKQEKSISKHLTGIFLLNLCCIFFFACSLQVTSSITLFVDRNIPKHIFGIDIPTAAFSSLDPLFVVVMAPFFVGFWKVISNLGFKVALTSKMAMGILWGAAAYTALYFAAKSSIQTDSYVPLLWLVLANVLLGGGEVCIVPPVFSAISRYSPENLKSTMIGSWYLFVAIAGFLAGQLSKLSDFDTKTLTTANKIITAHIYSHAFFVVGTIALVSAIVVYFSRPLFSKLLENE